MKFTRSLINSNCYLISLQIPSTPQNGYWFQDLNQIYSVSKNANILWSDELNWIKHLFPSVQFNDIFFISSEMNTVKVQLSFLDNNFPQRCIGRKGNLSDYPPRSLDRTPIKNWKTPLRGLMKDRVYDWKPRNLEHIKREITNFLTTSLYRLYKIKFTNQYYWCVRCRCTGNNS